MMLKDSQGRKVLIRIEYNSFGTQPHSFVACDGLNMEQVDEAITSEGDEIFLDKDQIRAMMDKDGMKDVNFTLTPDSWRPVEVLSSTDWTGGGLCGYSLSSKRIFKVDGKVVSEEFYRELDLVIRKISEYNGISSGRATLQSSGIELGIHKAMEMIGLGKVVTPSSLKQAMAKDDDRPRLLPGDSVKVKIKGGKEAFGVIRTIRTNVTVLKQDGTKMTCVFSNVSRTEEDGHNEGLANQIEPTIRESLEYVIEVGKKRIYRAKLEKGNFTFPMFPNKDRWGHDERQIEREGIHSCVCPICSWRMADIHEDGEFVCCYCRTTGMVISRKDDEVSLFMQRTPGKNRFAIKETRCCSNCGQFQFEVGRQGKRSTGYCKAANQCVQAYTVCDLWFPRAPKIYDSNIRQHITNLKYGISDGRNTQRNDIKDTVYKEEDHKAEIDRSEKAKVSYANAYQKFMKELNLAAAKVPVVMEMTRELSDEWNKVLDDPC